MRLKKTTRPRLTRKFLIRNYVAEDYTLKQFAQKVGTTVHHLAKSLKWHDLPTNKRNTKFGGILTRGFVLCNLKDKTTKQAALMVGCSENTIRKYKHKFSLSR